MRRDQFSANSGSDDSEANERTGLVRHSSALGFHPYFGSSSERRGTLTVGDSIRGANMTGHFRDTFTATGVGIGVRDVTQIRHHRFRRCFPRWFPSTLACESVTAYMGPGQLHCVVDVDGAAAKSLLQTIAERRRCDAGEVVIAGSPRGEGSSPRQVVGVVSRASAAVPNLSVERNLRFVLDMRTSGNRDWKSLMVQSVTAFVGLSPDHKAASLDAVGQLSLRLAMELVLDPPIIVAFYPLEGLDYATRARAALMLKNVASVLQKTVVLSTTSLGAHLFELSDTTLLFGAGGRVLFSGPSAEMTGYFNALRVPRYRASGDGAAVLFPTPTSTPRGRDSPSDAASVHSSRFTRSAGAQDATRISSRLFSDEIGTPSTRLALPGAAVLVSSGDDALDLAVEWADSPAQTMFYAAKFFDSAAHGRLVAAVTELASHPRPGEAASSWAPSPSPGAVWTAAPPHPTAKPIILLKYFARQVFTEADFLPTAAGLVVVLVAVATLLHFQPEDQGGMYNTRGMLFLLYALVLILNAASMGGIAGQLRLFLHQRSCGLYGTLCYVFCLTIRVVMVRVVYLALLVPFVLFVIEGPTGVVVLVGVVSVTHALLLYALHALVPSRRGAAWCAHAYFGFSLMCSGFLLNFRTLPPGVGGASVVRWGYGPALKEKLLGSEYHCDGAGNTSYCYTGEEYLRLAGFTHDSVLLSFGALAAMAGVFLAVMTAALALR